MTDLRYPIGEFKPEGDITDAQRSQLIAGIAVAPMKLMEAVKDLTPEQVDTAYRPGGWSVRQVVHHLADSHLNSYVRFRLALTEEEPTVKPYDEKRWAELEDARTAPLELSVALLEALHARWVLLLRSLRAADFDRTFRHPERGVMTLDRTLRLYEWHGRHHVAQIISLRERMGWL